MGALYFRSWKYPYATGFDGAGVFDYTESPFVSDVSSRLRNVGTSATPGLPEADKKFVLRPRNGVHRFGFISEFPSRFAVFDCSISRILGPLLSNPKPVLIGFARAQEEMCAANLEVPDIRDSIQFVSSEFDLYDNSTQMIDFNRIAQGALPLDHLSDPLEAGLVFRDIGRYEDRKRDESLKLHSLQPRTLSISLETLPPIVALGSLFLFREDVVDAISGLEFPGTFFPEPSVAVSYVP